MNTFADSLRQDLRYALRGMARSPIFTLTAVLAAALGIGATTAVFSVVDRILFRSLPYPQDDRLVSLGMMAPLDTNEFLLPDAYFIWRKNQQPFEFITSFTAGVVDCDLTEEHPARLGCGRVEDNFLPAFGLSPFLGRNFTPQEDRPGAPKVALISYGLWQRRFGGDPTIPGKVIALDGQAVTLIGVLPPAFEMPTLVSADVLLPQALNEATERSSRFLRVFAKLKPGVSVEQARVAMQPLFGQSLETVPPQFRKEVHFRIRSLRDRQVQDARLASWVLLAAVGSVLLIACANIANLLLARSMGRQRELALRIALGASRVRLMRQALTEALVLGVAGGVIGSALAWALVRVLVGIAPNGIPRLEQASLDGRVLLFTLTASLLAGLIFGLAPATQAPKAESLTGWRVSGGRRMPLRESLVTAQIAMALVLLTSAGMLLRSLWRLESVPLGIQADHVVVADFTLGKQRYAQDARQLEFFNELETRMAAVPGATTVVISDSLPPVGGSRARPLASIQVDGQPRLAEGTGGMVAWRYVSPGYFKTLGIPILRGRGFEEPDRAPGEEPLIVSESLGRRLFPQQDPLGKRLIIDAHFTVVGVAADVRNAGATQRADPEYYALRKHTLDDVWRNQMPGNVGWRHAFVAIRTPLNPATVADWMKREIAALDPTLPVTTTTMDQRVSRIAQGPRFNAILLSLFAAIGVLLAAIGLYGVMAFLVGQRTQEIGVRMALGATRSAITKLVLSKAMLWTLSGAALGLVGSFFAANMLRTLLFEMPDKDPWTFAVALPVLVAITLAAAWIPSRRAARVDPIAALRHE
ncbi:MAG: ABC transporter permease [Bryobacteraceae bacterium]